MERKVINCGIARKLILSSKINHKMPLTAISVIFKKGTSLEPILSVVVGAHVTDAPIIQVPIFAL